MKIPVYKPSIGDEEKFNVNQCLNENWISSRGRFVEQFEKDFAEYNNNTYALTVCNGTVAIHLALLALGIKAGDEVIVPTFTYIASVNAIKYCGAEPVFCDSRFDDWQIDPKAIEAKITKNTKAIMVVHLYGHPCDMTSIMKIAKKYNLFVVEDCAEAIGSKHKGQNVGTFGDISSFSFFGNKTITTGEGGMVVTNSEQLYSRAKLLRGQGLSKDREYWHDVVGYNYRMTNIAAAIGVAQLKKVNQNILDKRNIAHYYEKHLKSKFTFHKEVGKNFHTYWMCSILLPEQAKHLRDDFRKYLSVKGIETRPLFYPIHTMPMYFDRYEKMQVCENISCRGLNLPSYPTLTKQEQDYIIDACMSYEGVK